MAILARVGQANQHANHPVVGDQLSSTKMGTSYIIMLHYESTSSMCSCAWLVRTVHTATKEITTQTQRWPTTRTKKYLSASVSKRGVELFFSIFLSYIGICTEITEPAVAFPGHATSKLLPLAVVRRNF